MDDLISRAEALKALKDMSVTYDAETVQRCIEAVSNLPSAQPEDKCGECDAWNQYKNYPRPTVDAVPVIRCKVCLKKRLCSLYREANDENGFCAWAAERKEE